MKKRIRNLSHAQARREKKDGVEILVEKSENDALVSKQERDMFFSVE